MSVRVVGSVGCVCADCLVRGALPNTAQDRSEGVHSQLWQQKVMCTQVLRHPGPNKKSKPELPNDLQPSTSFMSPLHSFCPIICTAFGDHDPAYRTTSTHISVPHFRHPHNTQALLLPLLSHHALFTAQICLPPPYPQPPIHARHQMRPTGRITHRINYCQAAPFTPLHSCFRHSATCPSDPTVHT